MRFLYSLFLCLWMLTLASCQQIADEAPTGDSSEQAATSAVNVTTRAAVASQILYPVYVYAFDGDGAWAASQTVNSENEDISLALGIGEYKIVALSGVSKGYTLPQTPTLDSVIALGEEGFAYTPMMMGRSDVSITQTGRTVQLEMTMTYMVSQLSVNLTDVPSTVEGVSVTLSTFYSSVAMDGTYAQGGRAVTVDCEQEENGEWSADALYLLPSDKEAVTCTITFQTGDVEESFSYTYPSAITAGAPFNFVGSYKGNSNVEGKLDSIGWKDPVDVDFTFGGGDNEGEDDTEDDSWTDDGAVSGSFPQVGEVWNDGLVVWVEDATDTEADVLLMSLKEWTSTAGKAETTVAAYATQTGLDWRLITDEEAKEVKALFDESTLAAANASIASQTATYDPISNSGEVRYLCSKNGVMYSFRFETTSKVTKAGSSKEYLLRAVRNVHYRK